MENIANPGPHPVDQTHVMPATEPIDLNDVLMRQVGDREDTVKVQIAAVMQTQMTVSAN